MVLVAIRIFSLAALLSALPLLAHAQTLTVEGTEFVLTLADGRIFRSADLVGATLKVRFEGRDIEVTIKRVEEDPYSVGGQVFLHHFLVKDDSGKLSDLCAPDAIGKSLGFPVPDGRGGFDLTCTSGAVGKCIRWGYRLWEEKPGGPPMRALHQACTHMARADYGGDGHPFTREGTLIDMYDRFNIQTSDKDAPMTFEAAWGVDGAICVAHPRIPENISLEGLAERYPRLKSHLGPVACTEENAKGDPAALLFNRSKE
jgi:ADYC domain